MNMRLLGSKLLHADRRTDMTNKIAAFGNVTKALKSYNFSFSTAAFVEISQVVASTERLGAHWQLQFLNYLVAGKENTSLYKSARTSNFSVNAT
jgi:hypothetical protein